MICEDDRLRGKIAELECHAKNVIATTRGAREVRHLGHEGSGAVTLRPSRTRIDDRGDSSRRGCARGRRCDWRGRSCRDGWRGAEAAEAKRVLLPERVLMLG